MVGRKASNNLIVASTMRLEGAARIHLRDAYGTSVLASLPLAPRGVYDGGCSIEQSPTSQEVMALYAPKDGALEELETALKSVGADMDMHGHELRNTQPYARRMSLARAVTLC